jgi:outer membrane protein, multidrug efflux system
VITAPRIFAISVAVTVLICCPRARGQDLDPEPRAATSAGPATRSLHAEGGAPSIVRSPTLTELLSLDALDDSILSAMMRAALAQNHDLSLARARVDEARALVGVAHAFRFPVLTVNADIGANRMVLGSAALSYHAWRATADASWDVDVWGRARRESIAATADFRAGEMVEQAVMVSLISDVAVNYLQLLELDEEYDIAVRACASRRTILALAQARYQQGLVSEFDVQQSEAQVAVARARLARIAGDRARFEHALNALLGEPPDRTVRRGSLAAVPHTVVVPDSISTSLADTRPDVVQAKHAYEAAAARLGAARAARLPPLSVGAAVGRQAPTPGTVLRSQSDVYELRIGLSVPLLTGGRASGEVSAARARADQARIAYERARLTADHAAADAMAALRTSRDEVEANEALCVALRRALELSVLRYQSGVANLLEVLEPQRALFDAELTLAQSRFRGLAGMVELYEAVGGSWAVR